MAGRPRCASCRKAFTPHPRNRTKLTNRQRVCGDCGPVTGHKLASQRYRQASCSRPRALPRSSATAPSLSPVASELVHQLQRTCTALSALAGPSAVRDGLDPSSPLAVSNGAPCSSRGRVMASRGQIGLGSGST